MIGSPNSGKTTTAAGLFSNVKQIGLLAEYIPEQARVYIAEKRKENSLKPTDKVILKDQDQLSILKKQLDYENLIMASYGTDCILISDTSPLNTLLYMSPEARNKNDFLSVLKQREKQIKVKYFYCEPVPTSPVSDPNRIHSLEESLKINSLIPEIILPFLEDPMLILKGDSQTRIRTALVETLGYSR